MDCALSLRVGRGVRVFLRLCSEEVEEESDILPRKEEGGGGCSDAIGVLDLLSRVGSGVRYLVSFQEYCWHPERILSTSTKSLSLSSWVTSFK